MPRISLDVKIRPQRLAVLLRADVDPALFYRALEFLSLLWGGRYCYLLPITEETLDESLDYLFTYRPDLVVTLETTGIASAENLSHAISPLPFYFVSESWIEELRYAHFIGATANARLVAKEEQLATRSEVRSFDIPEKCFEARMFYGTSFGAANENLNRWLSSHLNAAIERIDQFQYSEFVNHCKEQRQPYSWLDIGSAGLDRTVSRGDLISPPTLVVVQDPVPDLSLFWNIRSQYGAQAFGNILPFPIGEVNNPESIQAAVQWVLENGIGSNHCRVTSSALSAQPIQSFVTLIRKGVQGTNIDHVDTENGRDLLPIVVPHVLETSIDVHIENRILSFRSPEPEISLIVSEHHDWIADIGRGNEFGSVLANLAIPKSRAMEQVLLAATPPNLNLGWAHPAVHAGIESLSFRCSRRHKLVKWMIPSPEELFHAHLIDCGAEPVVDEKRQRYEAAMERIGNLNAAAQIFIGDAGKLISVLQKGPHRRCELASHLPKRAKDNADSNWDKFIDRQPEHTRRVTRARIEESEQEYLFAEDSLDVHLKKWAKRRIVERRWYLGPCEKCLDSSWLQHLDIQKPVLCPGCGCERTLRNSVELGYELNPLMRKAIEEGIVSVVLAARVFANMKTHGFFWLGGQKLRIGDSVHDIDLLGSCDGCIVVGECKTLANAGKKSWQEARTQFVQTIALAKTCRASIVFFACLANLIPTSFTRGLKTIAGKDIGLLLLDKPQLEKGLLYREVEGSRAPASIYDFLPQRRRRKRKRRGTRTISL